MSTSATYTAEELAGRLGVSSWAVYESVRRGDCPVEPIRVGRRLVWPRAVVDRLLGLGGNEIDQLRSQGGCMDP
jgi:predicted DNA-binding transcriptional regulator AlpA